MSFGNVVLMTSAVGFCFAFLWKIDATKRFAQKMDNATDADLESLWASITKFHNKNREGCLKFYFSNAALLATGLFYDASATSRIIGALSFGATLYSFLNLKDGFQASKSFTDRTTDATKKAVSSVTESNVAKKVDNILDIAEARLQNSAFGRATNAIEDAAEGVFDWLKTRFSSSSSSKKGGRG